jgi:hypothetical protein
VRVAGVIGQALARAQNIRTYAIDARASLWLLERARDDLFYSF